MQERKQYIIGKEYKTAQKLGLVLQGETPTLGTQFYLSYSKDGIQVRVEAEIDKRPRAAFKGEFVPVWNGDAVEVFLSPYGREDWYYEFDLAPNGSFFYGHIYNPDGCTGYNRAFPNKQGVKADLQIIKGLWTVNIFIPFSAMGLQDKTLDEIKALPWRFNVYRIEDRKQEYSSFAPTYAQEINFHVSTAFADLIFE
jgi:hypothetical protein